MVAILWWRQRGCVQCAMPDASPQMVSCRVTPAMDAGGREQMSQWSSDVVLLLSTEKCAWLVRPDALATRRISPLKEAGAAFTWVSKVRDVQPHG